MKSKNTHAYFNDIEVLESFEVVSREVSNQYVPIYTSEVIKTLTPEFTFIEGVRYCNGLTMHSVFLTNEEGDCISIDNSYDRSRAFSFRFLQDNLAIPLDLDRQIHRGQNAKTLVSEMFIDKKEITIAINNAKHIVNNLKNTHIPNMFKEQIIDIIFSTVKARKNFIELDLIIADSYNTFYDFINTVVDRYLKGEYHTVITAKSGEKIRKGRKISSRFHRLEITNKIYKLLEVEAPEIFV